MSAWVWACSINYLTDLHRTSHRFQAVSIDNENEEGERRIDIPFEGKSPADGLYERDMQNCLLDAMEKLDNTSREIVKEVCLNGVPAKEYSKAYNITDTCTYLRIFRAKKKLFKHINLRLVATDLFY